MFLIALMGLTYERFSRDYFAHRNHTFSFMSFAFRGRKLMTTKMSLSNTFLHLRSKPFRVSLMFFFCLFWASCILGSWSWFMRLRCAGGRHKHTIQPCCWQPVKHHERARQLLWLDRAGVLPMFRTVYSSIRLGMNA